MYRHTHTHTHSHTHTKQKKSWVNQSLFLNFPKNFEISSRCAKKLSDKRSSARWVRSHLGRFLPLCDASILCDLFCLAAVTQSFPSFFFSFCPNSVWLPLVFWLQNGILKKNGPSTVSIDHLSFRFLIFIMKDKRNNVVFASDKLEVTIWYLYAFVTCLIFSRIS